MGGRSAEEDSPLCLFSFQLWRAAVYRQFLRTDGSQPCSSHHRSTIQIPAASRPPGCSLGFHHAPATPWAARRDRIPRDFLAYLGVILVCDLWLVRYHGRAGRVFAAFMLMRTATRKQDARCTERASLPRKQRHRFRMPLRSLYHDLRLGDFLLSVSRSSFAAGGGGTAPFSTISFAGISLP